MVKVTLSKAQSAVLAFISARIADGPAPTAAEIAAHMGYSSQNAARLHILALIRKGHLIHTPGTARGLMLSRCEPFNDTNLWELFPQLMKGKRRGTTRI